MFRYDGGAPGADLQGAGGAAWGQGVPGGCPLRSSEYNERPGKMHHNAQWMKTAQHISLEVSKYFWLKKDFWTNRMVLFSLFSGPI